MATYEFKCECGEVQTRDFAMDKIKKRVKCPVCGKMAKKVWSKPNAIARYSLIDRSRGDARIGRGKGV